MMRKKRRITKVNPEIIKTSLGDCHVVETVVISVVLGFLFFIEVLFSLFHSLLLWLFDHILFTYFLQVFAGFCRFFAGFCRFL